MFCKGALATPATVVLIALLAACGGDGGGGTPAEGGGGGDGALVVYSGRQEELVGPLFEMFEQATGIEVAVRYGDSAELAATIAEEGDSTPADVFFAQDPGSLGAVEKEGLLALLPAKTLRKVPERFRDPDGRWIGTSGRIRVVAYNTEALAEREVPDSIFDFAHARWKGKIGFPPTNASFQAFVTAMRLSVGDERTREWLEAIRENEPRLYENNIATVEAVAAGEIDVGFVNHYYLYLIKAEQPGAPVANHFLAPGDPGALVSVAGAAVLEPGDRKAEAERFVSFLLSEEAQRFYAEDAEEAEYPLVEGVEPRKGLVPLDRLRGPKIELDVLGRELEETLELLNEVGFST